MLDLCLKLLRRPLAHQPSLNEVIIHHYLRHLVLYFLQNAGVQFPQSAQAVQSNNASSQPSRAGSVPNREQASPRQEVVVPQAETVPESR
jgi:hypothetical protein